MANVCEGRRSWLTSRSQWFLSGVSVTLAMLAGMYRNYSSYVNGQHLPSEEWVYVLSADSLLDDVFASLALKRKLEQGRIPPHDLPSTVVGRVAKADRATIQRAVEAAAAAAPAWSAVPSHIRMETVGRMLHARLADHAEDIAAVLVEEGHPWHWRGGRSPACWSASARSR